MISQQLLKLAQKYDWKKHQDGDDLLVFGSFNEFLFTAMEGKGFKAFFTPLAGINPDALDELKVWLASQEKPFRLRNYEMTDNFLCIRLQESWRPRSVSQMESFLIHLTGKLDELELPENVCAICGQPAGKRGLYVGLLCNLHPECLEKEGTDFTQAVSGPQAEKPAQPPADEKIAELAASMAEYKDDILQGIHRIIAIPSVKSEAAVDAPYGLQTAEVLREFLTIAEACGFETVNLDNRVGYIEWGEGQKLIAALCHLDVVPAGTGWSRDPFESAMLDDRLIGRGVLDDKGPAVAVLYALKALHDEGFTPSARIRLIVGLDEEHGSDCMEYYKQNAEIPTAGFTADASFPVIHAEKGIIWVTLRMKAEQSEEDSLRLIKGEGGSAFNMVAGHCSLQFADREPLHFEGRQAHASKPENGINAIALAMKEASSQFEAASCSHPFVEMFQAMIGQTTDGGLVGLAMRDDSGALTINAGRFELDENQASISLDIRYPVTRSAEEIRSILEKEAQAYGADCIWDKHQPPLFMDKKSDLIASLSKVYQVLTDTDAEPAAIGGGTYARSLDNIAAFGPAFPGDPDECHQADESVSVEKLLAAAAIYREAIRVLSRD